MEFIPVYYNDHTGICYYLGDFDRGGKVSGDDDLFSDCAKDCYQDAIA